MKDNFSNQAAIYAKYRPAYPPELFKFILDFVNKKQLAWDCGTGNGQSAIILSRDFEKVYATDISSKQIAHASKALNILYKVEPAEQTSIKDDSVDLITISQALHWFNFDKFYEEVRRVSKPDAIIAAWTYSLLRVEPAIDKLIQQHHFETLEKYWDKERQYVDKEYKTIPFPFEVIKAPAFFIRLNWNPEELEGYLNTWSALQNFIRTNNYNPVDELINKIKQNWPGGMKKPVIFPVHLLIGKVY